LGVVNGEVWRGQLQLQQVLLSSQMQGAGFGGRLLALLQQVGDVFAGESLKGEGVFHGPGDRFDVIKLAQGDDLLDVMFGIEAPLLQLLVVLVRLGAQGQKARKSFCSRALLQCKSKGATWSGNS